MAGLLRMSDAASLAIHAMALMAGVQVPLQVPRIAKSLAVSEAHLSKVLQRLSKTSLLTSVRGPKGGYMLNRPPGNITLLEIWETIDGPLDRDYCLLNNMDCKRSGACVLKNLTRSIYDDVTQTLGSASLENVQLAVKLVD